MSDVLSWVSDSSPCPFTSSAPIWSPGCQMQKTAPVGSAITAMRPASITSKGSANRVPPSSRTLAAVASASSTVTYAFQAGGWPSCWTVAECADSATVDQGHRVDAAAGEVEVVELPAEEV